MRVKKDNAVFAVILATVVLLVTVVFISFFTARSIVTQQHISSGALNSEQAFSAAQAGLEYGLTHLNQNQSSVSNGTTLNGTLTNGATYSVLYEFQGGSSDLVKIKVSGVSTNTEATRTVEQLVKRISIISDVPTLSIQTRQLVRLRGNTTVTNLENNNTILSGAAVDIGGSAITVLQSGESSNNSTLGPDVVQNNPAFNAMDEAQFEVAMLGRTIESMQALANLSFTKYEPTRLYE